MALSPEDSAVFNKFLSIVYRLDDDVIDRAILALNNEKTLKKDRDSFARALSKSGVMSKEEALQSILAFQRKTEQGALDKNVLKNMVGNKAPVQKEVVNNGNNGAATASQEEHGATIVKAPSDPLKDLM